MSDMLKGTRIVMEGIEEKEDIALICIDYKLTYTAVGSAKYGQLIAK